MTDWQPIETAPDETWVLTFGTLHEIGENVGETPAVQLSMLGKDGWYSALWGGHEPTHWMPLPNPPA